jgi:hypothetical protein
MNTTNRKSISRRTTALNLFAGLPALLIAVPLVCFGRSAALRDQPHGPAPAFRPAPAAPAFHPAPAPAFHPAPAMVDRSSHGSVRHVDTQVIQRPVVAPREPVHVDTHVDTHVETHVDQHPVDVHRAPEHPVEVRHDDPRGHEIVTHRDVDVDFRGRHGWDGFAFGRHHPSLPIGCLTLSIGGVPYYYSDGIYYQPVGSDYQEVYPPVGAEIPAPPDGAIEVDAGGQTYYYAGGAFYVLQPDGSYAIAPTPIGVVVPELPPGAVQVSVNGGVAYQFNGIYYEPVFVNGVTQYETFQP